MTRTRLLLSLFVAAALVQLAAPVSLIWQYEATLRLGRAYKIYTAPVDPYDALRGRYVALQFEPIVVPLQTSEPFVADQPVYAHLEAGPDGVARFSVATLTPPAMGEYLRVPATKESASSNLVRLHLPFDRFYMEEHLAPQAERAYQAHSRRGQQDAYILLRVRHGRGAIENLYVAGQPIAVFVRTLPPS